MTGVQTCALPIWCFADAAAAVGMGPVWGEIAIVVAVAAAAGAVVAADCGKWADRKSVV